MNKEDLIVKYFTGNYAYNLYLMGLIFGNPIYSEYILNKEYLNGAIVGTISSIFLATKEKMVDKNNNILLPFSLMEKNVNLIANKTSAGYEINGYVFKDGYELVTTVINKLAHGEYLVDFAHNRVILKVEGNEVVIPISKLSAFVVASFSSTLQNYNVPSFSRNFVYSEKVSGKDKERYSLNEIIKKAGLKNEKPIVLIFGGSQGAQKINEAIIEIIKQKQNKEYQIMWATGPKQYDIVKEKLEENRISINNVKNAKIVPYIYNMEEMINISDLIVARSGAMTITEISNLGKPSILIPLPNVSHNHQLYNAQVLEKIGAAKIILDNELKGEILQKTIMQILQGNTAKTMGKNALKAETKDAEDRIYSEIVQLVRKE